MDDATARANRIFKALVDGLDDSEVRQLCFVMGYGYEDLGGGNRRDKVRALVEKCEQRHSIPRLVAYVQHEYPHIDLLATSLSAQERPVATQMLKRLGRGEPVTVKDDRVVRPTRDDEEAPAEPSPAAQERMAVKVFRYIGACVLIVLLFLLLNLLSLTAWAFIAEQIKLPEDMRAITRTGAVLSVLLILWMIIFGIQRLLAPRADADPNRVVVEVLGVSVLSVRRTENNRSLFLFGVPVWTVVGTKVSISAVTIVGAAAGLTVGVGIAPDSFVWRSTSSSPTVVAIGVPTTSLLVTATPDIAQFTIDVAGENLAFSTTTLTVEAGQQVSILVRNNSTAQQHSWVLVNGGDDVAAAVDEDAIIN
jgi:Effector-associated domain 7